VSHQFRRQAAKTRITRKTPPICVTGKGFLLFWFSFFHWFALAPWVLFARLTYHGQLAASRARAARLHAAWHNMRGFACVLIASKRESTFSNEKLSLNVRSRHRFSSAFLFIPLETGDACRVVAGKLPSQRQRQVEK